MSIQLGPKRWISIAAIVLLAVAGTTAISGIQGTGFRALAVFATVDAGNDGLRLNGVPYDVSHARVIVNGRTGDVSQVRTGHIVAAQGNVPRGKSTAVADEIILESDVRGEVTSVDPARATFTVLGQTVQLTEQSILDERIQPNDLSGLPSGTWVKVSAFERSDGTFVASRVDLDLAPYESQVRGVVHSVDRANRELRIGALTVDYSAATTRGNVADGAIVVARGSRPQTGGTLFASRVEVFSGVGHGGEHGDIRGIVTAFASAADFEINGQPVLADAKTVYVLHGQQLGPDVEVRVKGRFDSAGVLIADKVQIDTPKKPGKK